MTIELLVPIIRRLIRERGFKSLTEPQLKAIPYILNGDNVLIVAPTGSGKTEAAMLPIFQLMMKNPGKGIRLVYITPLRALNRDIIDRIIWWSSKLGFSIAVRHGDTTIRERRMQAQTPPDILITTPETFSLLLNTRVMAKHLENVRWIVIDEIHELVNNKRGAQLSINIERLAYKVGKIQRIGLSATVGNPQEVLKYLVGSDGEGIVIDVDISKSIKIDVIYPHSSKEDYHNASRLYTYPDVVARVRNIVNLVKKHTATLIFTNTRPMAEILGSRIFLYDEELPIMVHHGSLSRNIRVRIERFLKERKIKGIICTSSLELGIDIGDIDLVIQYNSPRQVSRVIQRVGRSGHWIERVSKGIVIVQDLDDLLESIIIRERVYKNLLEPIKIIKNPLDVLLHEISGMLITRSILDIDEIFEIIKNSYVYNEMNKEELVELLEFASSLTERILYLDRENNKIRRPLNRKRLFDYYFSVLSMIPDVRQYIVIDDTTNTPVGILDEEFVSLYCEPNTKFIMAGRPWKIIQIYKDKVYVNPEEDFFGAIPDWVGEEIPVPYEVAQDVGRLKREIVDIYNTYEKNIDKLREELDKRYGLKNIKELDVILRQIDEGYPLPTDNNIIIDNIDDKIIIYIHGGTIMNRTLAGYITQVLHDEYGETVYYSSDPYRIFLQNPNITPSTIAEILKSRRYIERYIKRAVETSRIFLLRLIHVARRMGIVSKKKMIDYRDAEILYSTLKGTPAFKEAYKETIFKDFDIEKAKEVLMYIVSGNWGINMIDEGPSPLTEDYLIHYEIKFEKPRVDRLKTLQILSTRARLMNQVRTYICIECFNYVSEMRVKDLPEKIMCPHCKSTKIGLSDELPEEVERILDLARNRLEYIKRHPTWRKIVKTSEMIAKYGKTAAFVLSSTNITLKDAETILREEKKISGRLINLILEAEKKNLLKRFR
jgi:ATP-dependent Lhr-like helicase